MATATVADYSIVTDSPVTPPGPFAFGVDKHINLGTRSVLTYVAIPATSDFTFKMFMNSVQLEGGTVKVGQGPCALQEVIDGDVLVPPPGTNNLLIEVTKGSGTFRDIVLLYQDDVTAAPIAV